MTTEQPNALRLADALDHLIFNQGHSVTRDLASSELRRLHAVNAELVDALKMLLSYTKACEGLLNCTPAGQIGTAEAAIAKAGDPS